MLITTSQAIFRLFPNSDFFFYKKFVTNRYNIKKMIILLKK